MVQGSNGRPENSQRCSTLHRMCGLVPQGIANGLQSFQNCGLLSVAEYRTFVSMTPPALTKRALTKRSDTRLNGCLALTDILILKGIGSIRTVWPLVDPIRFLQS